MYQAKMKSWAELGQHTCKTLFEMDVFVEYVSKSEVEFCKFDNLAILVLLKERTSPKISQKIFFVSLSRGPVSKC